MTDAVSPGERDRHHNARLLEENRRLAQRCLELEDAARQRLEKLRAANAVLARGEADIRTLLENASVGFALVDVNLRIASANKTLVDLLGYARNELPGINFGALVFVGKLPAFTRLTNRHKREGKFEELIELVKRDGGLLPVRMAVSDWLDDTGAIQGHFLLVFDVGAEITASGRLREVEQTMAEAEKSRSVFLDVIGRELRSPANGILGMSRMLMEAGLTERQAELAGVIHSSAASLVRLVDDVVDIVRMDATETKPNPVPVNPSELAASALGLFNLRAEEKGLDLRLHSGHGLPEAALLDPVIVRRILVHLLDNALKFTERGYVSLSVDVVSDQIRFMVSDTGPGLEPDAESRLFCGAQTQTASCSRRFGGAGLGLAICRRLISLAGGRLAFESAPGHGSEFHVTLPLIVSPAGGERADLEPPAEAIRLPAMKILLADANPISGRAIKAYLAFDGSDVVIASSGPDAAEKCRTSHFDLAILDLNLPKLGGLQTLALIRDDEKISAQPRLPVLILAADRQLREESHYLRAGADGIVKKPVQPVELMAKVAAAAGVAPLAVARSRDSGAYSARSGGGAIRRLDGRKLVNLRQVMPGEEFFGLLRFFVEDAVPGLVDIGDLTARGAPDPQRIAFAAAKAKSFAGFLGFSALAELLERLEKAARSGAPASELRTLAADLSEATDDSLEELKRIVPEVFTTISSMTGNGEKDLDAPITETKPKDHPTQ